MKKSGLARLSMENAPLVVGVVTGLSTLESIRSAPPSPRHYDAVELRLDFLPAEDQRSDRWLPLCGDVEKSGVPVILTIRVEREGGRWRKHDLARSRLFSRAMGGVSVVDIELSSPLLATLRGIIPESSTGVIGSYHNFSGTPSLMDLRLLVSDALKDGVDIVKVVTTVNCESDIETLTGLLVRKRSFPLCVIGMGAKGVETRFSFPALGSVLTYGYIDQPTAPGQLSCEELDARLRERIPAYSARKEDV